jgi:hypothetical protein
MERKANYVSHPCLHLCCKECWQDLFQTNSRANRVAIVDVTCPFCRTPIHFVSEKDQHLSFLKDAWTSHMQQKENQTMVEREKKKETREKRRIAKKSSRSNHILKGDESKTKTTTTTTTTTTSTRLTTSTRSTTSASTTSASTTIRLQTDSWVDSYFRSSKIRYIINCEILPYVQQEKIMIASQWRQFLDLIAKAIDYHIPHVRYSRLDGKSGSAKKKAKVISSFQNDSETRVCLYSMSTNSDGITLTAASRVVLCDQAWNDAQPYQCANRTHRIGQTKPVTFVRLIAQDTIECAVLEMASKKTEISAVVMGEQVEKSKMDYINNVKLLFQIHPRQGQSSNQV